MFTEELIDYFFFYFPLHPLFFSSLTSRNVQSGAMQITDLGVCCQIKTLKKTFVPDWTKTILNLKYLECLGRFFWWVYLFFERRKKFVSFQNYSIITNRKQTIFCLTLIINSFSILWTWFFWWPNYYLKVFVTLRVSTLNTFWSVLSRYVYMFLVFIYLYLYLSIES